MAGYFKNIYETVKALIQGMGVTGLWFFKPAFTLQYPDEKMTLPERSRGTLLFNKETCTACSLCVKACPSDCIALEPATDPITKRRIARAAWYQVDFGKCNYCGLCEEACPTKPVKSIRHGQGYEWATSGREELIIKWVRETAQESPPMRSNITR